MFYDCTIVPKDYNSKAKLAGFNDKVIQVPKAEIDIPAQAKATGSFTVTGLQEGKTSIKIDLGKSTKLALKVIPTFVLDPKKVKIAEIPTTGLTALNSGKIKKLEVYQNKLYLLDAKDTSETDHVKFYSSSDGKTWTDLGTPEDASDSNKKIGGQHFDTTVHDGKLWLTGSAEGGRKGVWNFDGKKWTSVGQGKTMFMYGSLVSFKNSLYQVGGEREIYAYDGSKWESKYTFANNNHFGRIDAVVFDGKIWIPGGRISGISSGASESLQTVASFDGTTYQKNVANLPAKSSLAAVEVFPRGLLAIGGKDDSAAVSAVFYSRFGTSWANITGIKDQSKLKPVYSGATVVWNGALWAVNRNREVLKITYEE